LSTEVRQKFKNSGFEDAEFNNFELLDLRLNFSGLRSNYEKISLAWPLFTFIPPAGSKRKPFKYGASGKRLGIYIGTLSGINYQIIIRI